MVRQLWGFILVWSLPKKFSEIFILRKPTLFLDQITGNAPPVFSHTTIHPILLLAFIYCDFADDSDLSAGHVSTKGICLFVYFMDPFHGYGSIVSKLQSQNEETKQKFW